jgi:hypothetical protein
MNFRKTIAVLLAFYGFDLFSQNRVEIIFDRDEKNEAFTKEILDNYDFFLLIDGTEYKIEISTNYEFVYPILSEGNYNKIKNEEFVTINYKNKKNCFITIFPNVFFDKKTHLQLDFYKYKDVFLEYYLLPERIKIFIFNNKDFRLSMKRLSVSYAIGRRWSSPLVYYCEEYYKIGSSKANQILRDPYKKVNSDEDKR